MAFPAYVTSNEDDRGFELFGTQASEKFYVWGAQLETAASAGQHVATLDSPVTVTADSTNILPSSQQIGGQGWGISQGTVSANSVTAPDGSLTADTVSATTGATNTYLSDSVKNPALFDSATVTGSVYLAVPSGTRTVLVRIVAANSGGGTTVATLNAAVTSTWQRFDVTGVTPNGLTALQLSIGSGTQISTGNPLYVWGAQMVMGSSAGTYDPTQNTTTSVVNGATVNLAANGMNQGFSYDAFGNMLQSGNFNFIQAYTPANQLSGWTYDASGNLLNNGLGTTFTYDAEGRISNAAGYTYVYDGNGDRVAKTGGAETDYIYFAGRQLARLSGGQWTDLIYGTKAYWLKSLAHKQLCQPIECSITWELKLAPSHRPEPFSASQTMRPLANSSLGAHKTRIGPHDLTRLPLISTGDPYRLFSTKYCGPGGSGQTTGFLDAACKAHDACYKAAGISAANNLPGGPSMSSSQASAAKSCNQALYNAVRINNGAPGAKAAQYWLTQGANLPFGDHIIKPGTEATSW